MLATDRRKGHEYEEYEDYFANRIHTPNEQQIRSSVRRAEKRYERRSLWPAIIFILVSGGGLVLLFWFS